MPLGFFAAFSHPFFFPLAVIVAVWSLAWKGVALWKSARSGHLVWFVIFIIANTAGILEIIYLAFFRKKKIILVSKKRKRS